MTRQKSWSELSRPQQGAIVVMGLAEVVLTAVAAVDLVRRPADQVRGPKLLWAAGLVVQPVGPIAYLAVGRRG